MQEKKYKKVLIYLGAILLIGLAGTVTILIVNKNKDKVELMVTDSNVIEQIELLEPVELMEPIEPAKQTEPIEDVLEVMGESLKNYSKIEPDVYISNDSTQIFVVSATKWKKIQKQCQFTI